MHPCGPQNGYVQTKGELVSSGVLAEEQGMNKFSSELAEKSVY